MKKVIALALLALTVAQASSSFALFGRRGYSNCCQPTCCQAVVVEPCCEQVVVEPCC